MDQKNLIVAIVLSVLIIMGWQYAFPPTKPPVNTTTQQEEAPGPPVAQAPSASRWRRAPRHRGCAADRQPQGGSRVRRADLDTPELMVDLKGARIDDVPVKYARPSIKERPGAGAVAGGHRASLLRRVRLMA
jgi:YidC/Oxa1 family membrane protein insertase